MKNIVLTVSYNGKNYYGWQKQNNKKTIQGELEYCINKLFKTNSLNKITINGSGRTDAGVHALSQVFNFNVETTIPTDKLPEILNNNLPKDISILKAWEADESFHSRFSAKGKIYKYQIFMSDIRSPFYEDFSYRIKYKLDIDKMKEEIKSLIGEHDFCGFMSSGSSVESTIRRIDRAEIYQDNDYLVIELEGNGFLYNMVRIIAGTLVDIGRGHISQPLSEIIDSKDRSKAGHTAPPQGLFLKKVLY